MLQLAGKYINTFLGRTFDGLDAYEYSLDNFVSRYPLSISKISSWLTFHSMMILQKQNEDILHSSKVCNR